MKSCNIKIGEKVYFKSDKHNLGDMYYTEDCDYCVNKVKSICELDVIEKEKLSDQIKNNIGFTVECVFALVEKDNDILVKIVDENGDYVTKIPVDAKFFRSEEKHNKLMKRKQEENENA